MYAERESIKANKSRAVANSIRQKKSKNKKDFDLVYKRPQAIMQINPKEIIDNKATKLEQIIQKSKKYCIQKAIKIEDEGPFTWQEVTAINDWDSLDENQVAAVRSWFDSKTEHNFQETRKGSGKQNLIRAAKRSQQAVVQGPALYKFANLKYITRAGGGRTPTLYFEGGGKTGRLRTKHSTGPLADIDKYPTVRLFTASKISNFKETYLESDNETLKANWMDGNVYGHTLIPTDNYYQLEVSHEGRKYRGKHPSGGKVSTNLSEYNDVIIFNIFNSITGNPELRKINKDASKARSYDFWGGTDMKT